MKNISIIGVGKLGLCFALTLEKAGYSVLGCDVSREYVEMLNEKTFRSDEPGVNEFLSNSQHFKATLSIEDTLNYSDIIFVLVATPSLENGRYDHSQVDSVVDQIVSFGSQDSKKHLVICCTTMPSYCDTIQERLKDYNYDVSYNPEFIAQGTIIVNQEHY